MINFVSTEDAAKTNVFLDELEDLMRRHNVWMHVAARFDPAEEALGNVIEIQSLEDMDDDDSEVNWFLEAVCLWPGEIERVVDVEESWE